MVTAPNPTLPNAEPKPGTHTDRNTFAKDKRARGTGATAGSEAISSSVKRGASAVTTAIAAKP